MRCRVILETYPPPTLQAKGSTYEERWHVLFPTQVYLYGVLTPFEVLHAWAAWFFVCLPLVSHISYNGKKQRFSWEIGRFFLFYLFLLLKNTNNTWNIPLKMVKKENNFYRMCLKDTVCRNTTLNHHSMHACRHACVYTYKIYTMWIHTVHIRKLAVASWNLLLLQPGRGSSQSKTVVFHVNPPWSSRGILERSWKQMVMGSNPAVLTLDTQS